MPTFDFRTGAIGAYDATCAIGLLSERVVDAMRTELELFELAVDYTRAAVKHKKTKGPVGGLLS